MLTHPERVPADAKPAARPAASLIERRLSLYRAEVQPCVRALAVRHPWLADLAASFPALLFALAFPRVRADAEDACRLVISGAPLAHIAQRARVPMWLRTFPAQAFAAPLPILPDNHDFRRRVANHLPASWKLAPRWIEDIGLAFQTADDEIALWFAREAPLKNKKKPRYARKRPRHYRRRVALWAWYSRHAPDQTCMPTPWRAELEWKAAVTAAHDWISAETLALYLGDSAIADPWLEDGLIDGYAFIALRTAADIEAEAAAMKHCIRTYGASIAGNDYRLFGVRRQGVRVATLALSADNCPMPNIVEISGLENSAVSNEVWLAARRWLHAQDAREIDAKRLDYREAKFNAAAWRKLWRPYWLAKRRIPVWLPLAPSDTAFYAL